MKMGHIGPHGPPIYTHLFRNECIPKREGTHSFYKGFV